MAQKLITRFVRLKASMYLVDNLLFR